MVKNKRTGRPLKDEADKCAHVGISKKHLIALDRLILASLGPIKGPTTQASELAKKRRDYLGALIEENSPKILVDMKRSLESQLYRLTERIESVEAPYLDFVGELLVLKDSIKNIEFQYDKRLEALEKKQPTKAKGKITMSSSDPLPPPPPME